MPDKIEGLEGVVAEDAIPADSVVAGIDSSTGGKEIPVEEQMLAGIKAAVTPADPAKVAEKKVADEAAAAIADANNGKTPEQIATEVAAKKQKVDAEAAAKLKAKSADDFALKPEEKKALSQAAQIRFNELHAFGKGQQAEAQAARIEVERLSKVTKTMQEVYEEFKVEPDDLVPLLEYNLKLKSGDLQGALKIVNEARAGILTALGREEPGVDLLKEFPDLAARVQNQEIVREDALELANSRRREAGARAQQEREQAGRRTEQTLEQAQNNGLTAIETWTKKMMADDIDFKAKETKILPKIDEIIKKNFDKPYMWLDLIQARYEGIEIVKPATVADVPLRPSGAKPGAKQHTELTPDALKDGLRSAGFGY